MRSELLATVLNDQNNSTTEYKGMRMAAPDGNIALPGSIVCPHGLPRAPTEGSRPARFGASLER